MSNRKKERRPKILRSRSELLDALGDQLRFLERSAVVYDAGDEAEASQLALRIRVLLHDTATSHALLHQLGMRKRMAFLDTGTELFTYTLNPDGTETHN